jgi:hypothetical protein
MNLGLTVKWEGAVLLWFFKWVSGKVLPFVVQLPLLPSYMNVCFCYN